MSSPTIKSVSEFIATIETRMIETGRIYLFRGQSNNFRLLPGIARPKYKFSFTKLDTEQRILDEFKAHSLPYLKIFPKTDLEYLVVAQHYGLPTRLLDWTENALAALFFAVSTKVENGMKPEVRVCSFPNTSDIIIRDYELKIFEQKNVKFFKPTSFLDRIISQSGWFSMHPQSGHNTGSYIQADKISNTEIRFSRIIIDPDYAGNIYRTLNDCGINKFSIFKDLDSLGTYLTSKYQGFKEMGNPYPF